MNSLSDDHPAVHEHEQQRGNFHDDEEEECRVCRGPAEEGRSLHKPCKCSGSIALTHQDCLQSWLEVKGGKGKCDLCSTIFKFAPKYAEDAPDTLSPLEVLSGLGRHAAFKWVPFALRAFFVASVWLGILPLASAYLYQGWMYRPSSIKARFTWDLVPGDLVNGAMLTLIIIVIFLSLLSLFDFFRLKWGRVEEGDNRIKDEEAKIMIAPVQVGERGDCLHYDDSERPLSEKFDAEKHIIEKMINESNKSVMDEGQLFRSYDDVDNDELEAIKRKKRDKDSTVMDDMDFLDQIRELQDTMERHEEAYSEEIERLREAGEHDQADGLMERRQEISEHYNEFHQKLPEKAVAAVRRQRHRLPNRDVDDNDSNNGNEPYDEAIDDMEDAQDKNEEDEDELYQRMMRMQEMDGEGSEDEEEEIIGAQRNDQDRAERFEPQFVPLDRPFDDEDPMDADLNMPIERMVGLRGPILDLFRNLGWLLAFQTTFIAIFTCIPRAIGSFVFNNIVLRFKYVSIFLQFSCKTVIFVTFNLNSKEGVPMDFAYLVKMMTHGNEERKNLLVPHDVVNIVFGYISLAVVSFVLQGFVRCYKRYEAACSRVDVVDAAAADGGLNADEVRQAGLLDRNRRDRFDHPDARPDDMRAVLTGFIFSAIEISAAAAKISFLVCFKMFILPFLLGTWLDLSTLTLFGAHIEDRMSLAGADIVGFFILHWVIGITFMLTVTVSVLQLREVLHPDLLAPVIRPQEPQPDLLINLLEESGWTHAKRMVPSLGIYAAILFVYVWLPCQLMNAASLQNYIPLFRPHFWYAIYSPLQRPIELMVFHLSVLSTLEKHKNKIGEMQHAFLLKVSNWVGVTECLLPRNVYAWMLVDEKPLHLPTGNNTIDGFWEDLVELNKKGVSTDDFILHHLSNLKSNEPQHRSEIMHRPNQFIILSPSDGSSSEQRKLMPTRIGMFSFRKKIRNNGTCVIEVWRECVNDPIPRPPKGWDYLADEGSVEYGRWAWGKKEKKSDIELRVAARKHFFPSTPSEGRYKEQWESSQFLSTGLPVISKLLAVAFVSWLAVTLCTSAALFLPLLIGRYILQILGLPLKYVHDPLVFAAGCIVLAPVIQFLFKHVCEGHTGNVADKRIRFSLPPFRKIVTLAHVFFLWLVVCPLLAGGVYHHCFIKTTPATIKSVDLHSLVHFWPVGFLLIHLWAALCYVGAFKCGFWASIHQIFVDGIAGVGPPENNLNIQRQDIGHRNGNNEQEIEMNNIDATMVNLSRGIHKFQGEQGTVGTFVKTLVAIFTKSEWDKIDRVVLIDEFLVPVARQLLILLFAPIVALVFAFVAGQLSPYLQSIVEEDAFQVYLYRYSVLNVVIIQLALGFQDALSSWFKAGHNAARDHRYLVGETLLDYEG